LRRDAEKYLRDGQDDFAEKCLSEAVELCPSDYESLEDRAGLLFKKKRLDDALKDLDRVLELSVNSHYSHYLKGKILMTKRDFAGALTEFNEAIKITDSKPEYYEKRGNCQFELGRY
jgi:tetratricopeptide (TPR) repeat protein